MPWVLLAQLTVWVMRRTSKCRCCVSTGAGSSEAWTPG